MSKGLLFFLTQGMCIRK